MKDCPDCSTNEDAVGEGMRCCRHEIAFLRVKLQAAEAAFEEQQKGALEYARKWALTEAALLEARDAALEEAAKHIETPRWSGSGSDFAFRIRALIGRKPATVPKEGA